MVQQELIDRLKEWDTLRGKVQRSLDHNLAEQGDLTLDEMFDALEWGWDLIDDLQALTDQIETEVTSLNSRLVGAL